MQDAREVLAQVLNCGTDDIDMLLETEIDISNVVRMITENGYVLDLESLYCHAFDEILYSEFVMGNVQDYNSDDFSIQFNYLDTHIYIKGNRADFYRENFPEILDAIEDYMDLEFQETED